MNPTHETDGTDRSPDERQERLQVLDHHQDQSHSPAPAIEVSGLTKSFGDVQALAGVDFAVHPGELFGFLGPNGAGKTTTIRILTGLSRADGGTVRVAGTDVLATPKAAQRILGVVPDESNLYPELTGFENLSFCGALYGMRKAERETRARELLETFGLAGAADRKFAGYSKGMKRKLTIAAGIVHRPQILFLDEPTTGIDVASARKLRQLIADLNAEGTTIFLTTHYIEEAQRLCDRIAFIVEGRIVRIDRLSDLLEPVQQRHTITITGHPIDQNLVGRLHQAFGEFSFELLSPDSLRVSASSPIHLGPVVRFLEDQGVAVTEARKTQPSLEDVFVEITGIEASIMAKDADGPGKRRAKGPGGETGRSGGPGRKGGVR